MDTTWERVREALGRGADADVRPLPDRAAVALVLREAEGAGVELLFIRRSEHPLDPWSGQMAFPGGRAEAGDPDLRATAIRETREEIGLDLAAAEYLGRLDEVRAMARLRPVNLTITPFVFRVEGPLRLAPDPAEVESVHWFPLALLSDPALQSDHVYEQHGARLQFPCLRIAGVPGPGGPGRDVVIWGLTFRMFTTFRERLAAVSAREPAGA